MDIVDGLADSVQRGWRTNSQIGHRHIIIDRSDEPDDPEVPMLRDLLIRDTVFPVSASGHLEDRDGGKGDGHTL